MTGRVTGVGGFASASWKYMPKRLHPSHLAVRALCSRPLVPLGPVACVVSTRRPLMRPTLLLVPGPGVLLPLKPARISRHGNSICRAVAAWTLQAQEAAFPRKEAECSSPDIHTPSPSPLSGFCSNVVIFNQAFPNHQWHAGTASHHSCELSFKEICKLGSIHDN